MRLDVSLQRGDGFTEVVASHNNEQVVFNTATYGKTKPSDTARIFEDINGYWESCSDEVQQLVWGVYRDTREYLDSALDPYHIERFLKRQVHLLFQYMPMETFSKWLLTKANLYIPSEIRDTLGEDSRYPRPDQTYLREDYINLSVLCLALRPLIPIWGEFINPERQGSTNDLYKEIEAIGLVAETELATWPKEKPAYEKLLNYIEITAESVPSTMASLWRGIGSTEIPLWLLAKVLVRRLTIVPLCDHQISHSIIANIYRYVETNLRPTDRNTKDKVKDKRADNTGKDDDDKTSFLEGYKVKQRVAAGDAVLYDVFSENMAGIAQMVDPTIDLHLLEKTTSVLNHMNKVPAYTHQIRLAQWVLAKAYSPRAFDHVRKQSVNRLLATTQALLWHWGFLDLACLVQVERISITDQDIPGIVQRPRAGSRIARKYDQVLMELYPYNKPQKQQRYQNDISGDSVNRSNNYAAIGINNITREIMRYSWYYCGPHELKTMAGQPEGRNLLVIPPKIKDQISDLVVHLAKLNR